jgi:hypothetical protein
MTYNCFKCRNDFEYINKEYDNCWSMCYCFECKKELLYNVIETHKEPILDYELKGEIV